MPRSLASHAYLVAVLLAACAKPAPPPPPITLKPADASLPTEFSFIGSVRELSDGRVIITDPKEERLFVVDSTWHGATEFGHHGEGPNEFRTLASAWPLGSDSTIVPERNVWRWVIYAGTEAITTIPRTDPRMAPLLTGTVIGSDRTGHLLGAVIDMPPGARLGHLPDSLLLVRVDLASGHADTVNRLFDGFASSGGAEAAGGAPAPGKQNYVVALMLDDRAAEFPDGWIVIARANPFRVDWCAPGHACVQGPRIEPALPMTTREKTAYLALTAKTTHWPPTADLGETSGWTKIVPPFVSPSNFFPSSPLVPLPDGRLLIQRLPSADFSTLRFDVINRTGTRDGEFSLALNQRIVGAGAHAVYVVTTNDDGIQKLERHPWP